MSYQSDEVKACIGRLIPPLVGLTITGAAVDETGEFWGFTAERQKDGATVKKVVFVLCDPEGNGPGFLDINDGMEEQS